MTKSLALFGLAATALAAPALAGPYDDVVEYVSITQTTGAQHFSIKNMAALKTVDARDLRVFGDNPQFTVKGTVHCNPDAVLTDVQVIFGKVIQNGPTVFAMDGYGQSEKVHFGDRSGALVSIPVELNVKRSYAGPTDFLGYSPARHFEAKLRSFVLKGGSAAQYLQTSEAFDLPIPVTLVAWCWMDPNADHWQAGKLVARASETKYVPASILYNGDPNILDGVGLKAAVVGSNGGVLAPEPTEPLGKQAPQASEPATRPARATTQPPRRPREER